MLRTSPITSNETPNLSSWRRLPRATCTCRNDFSRFLGGRVLLVRTRLSHSTGGEFCCAACAHKNSVSWSKFSLIFRPAPLPLFEKTLFQKKRGGAGSALPPRWGTGPLPWPRAATYNAGAAASCWLPKSEIGPAYRTARQNLIDSGFAFRQDSGLVSAD